MKFDLTIHFGNAAMQESEHLVRALREVAERILKSDYVLSLREEGTGSIDRGILDRNGNHVGDWSLTFEE